MFSSRTTSSRISPAILDEDDGCDTQQSTTDVSTRVANRQSLSVRDKIPEQRVLKCLFPHGALHRKCIL